jgi:hypothetical protein
MRNLRLEAEQLEISSSWCGPWLPSVVLQFAANNDIKIARSDLTQFGLVLANAAERRL